MCQDHLPPGSHVAVDEHQGGGWKLTIEMSTDDAQEGINQAQQYAEALAARLTFELAGSLPRPVSLDRQAPTFHVGADVFVMLQGVTAQGIAGAVVAGVGVGLWSANKVSTLLASLDGWMPHHTTGGVLQIARRIFSEGIGTSHPVSRFLIAYTAAVLLSVHKGKRGSQKDVDTMLLQFDASIATQPRADKPGVVETTYTAARNQFVHAEDRGQDPVKAIENIERLLPAFQHTVGQMLLAG